MDDQFKRLLKPQYFLALIMALIIASVTLVAGSIHATTPPQKVDFTNDWTLQDGSVKNADEVVLKDYGGSVRMSNKIPQNVKYNDCLCLVSNNTRFTVTIGNELIYTYYPPENLTGRGYGICYHYVNLRPEDSGKAVVIAMSTVFRSGRGGRIAAITVENAKDFRSRFASHQIPPLTMSVGIMILGIILIFMRLILPYRKGRPGIISLGLVALTSGIWLCSDTGFLRLIADAVMTSRCIDYFFMHIWLLPLMLFVHSVTIQRKWSYRIAMLGIQLVDIILLVFHRVVLDKDFSTLNAIMAAYYLSSTGLIILMICDDRAHSRKIHKYRNLKSFYMGLIFLAIGVIADFTAFACNIRSISGKGHFTRIGLFAFLGVMAVTTIRAWSRDQTSLKREHFINQMLHYAISPTDPDESIKTILEYIGTELEADHVYIYENQRNGIFHNTYEWFAKNAGEPVYNDYHDLPFRGLIDELFDTFKKDHRLVVDDSEETLKLNHNLYAIMKRLEISCMVVGPLEYENELLGLIGVDDAPKENCNELAGIMWLLSYFVTQLILLRDEKRNLLRYSYVDSLTGCRNRRALMEFESTSTPEPPFGYIMCDINGLKITNDTEGHEAGDKLIIDVAESLIDVFGENYVYRIGGDEFAAYSFERTRQRFDILVNAVKTQIASKNRSASIGAVYVDSDDVSAGDVDLPYLKETADRLMYEEKERFYQGANDRRK